MKRLLVGLCFVIGFIAFSSLAQAEEIKDILKKGEPLYPTYGSNSVKIGQSDALVIRGVHQTESASTGDVFTVLMRDKNNWQLVYRDVPKDRSPLFISQPHAYEDSVSSLRFFVAAKTINENKSQALYVLQATRDFGDDFSRKDPSHNQSSLVAFVLYQMVYDDGFDIYSFKEIKNEKTKTPYCNADWALFKELGIPVPKDKNEYDCAKLK